MQYVLYGDGIHDDYPAIQQLIDSGVNEVNLPAPQKCYLISKTLVLPSDFKLTLPRFAEIRLMENSNCLMLRNKWTDIEDAGKFVYSGRDKFWNYTNRISPEKEHKCKNVSVEGGIWNFNNTVQKPNPLRTLDFLDNELYNGIGFQFFNIENLTIRSLTLKNPVTYGVNIDIATDFTVEDITFEYTLGNPQTINMDGIHINGNCHRGVIKNLKGACFDDLVALNAFEGYKGDITDIVIENLFAENCHSAVRLLAITECIKNVHISNVFGTYYQYCIGLSKFYDIPSTDGFDNITIDNIYASKAPRTKDVFPFTNSYVYPLIWIQENVIVKNLSISHVHRKEQVTAIPTIYIGENTPVERLIIDDVFQENSLNEGFPVIHNKGNIKSLVLSNIRADKDEILLNEGTINNL